MLAGETERLIDSVLAGPLPEAFVRSLVEHQVIERVASELLDNASGAGSSEQFEQIVDRVLRSPALERWVASGDAGRLVEPLVGHVLQSPAFRQAMMEILASPELRHALSDQTSGFAGEIATAVRARTARGDDAVEKRVHRWLRLRRRTDDRLSPFAGFGSRGVGLVIDIVLAQLLFLVGAATIALVGSLVGLRREGPLTWTLTGTAWLLAATIYFVGFWSATGQTPGMRLMRLRVVTFAGRPPSVPRSILRFVGLLLAIAPAFAGFLLVFFDSRRRALQDFIARTVVLYDRDVDEPPTDESDTLDGVPASAPPPTRAASTLESTRAEVRGVRMHATGGGSGPPVVLVHGYGISGAYMLPLAEVLATSCSVFVPDLPGQGRSGQPKGPWGIRGMADSLGGWLDAVGLRHPLIVANSLGCQVVTELAVRRPACVGPMVLIGPTVDPARRAARHQLFNVLRDSAREPFSLLALAARDHAKTVDVRPLLTTARAALADRIEDRLPLVPQPSVVVYGEDDGFLSREWAERAAALLPLGRLVVVPSEPHAVHYTRPDLIAEIVHGLLVEERQHEVGKRSGRLEHGHVPAPKTYDAGPRQEPLPLVR
jgi:pimeloyl-ACP methyl ester carboxylesterase/uncharacterized RDD family membrane protein YckC